MPPTLKVLLLITDAGGGHRASADALKAACHPMDAALDVRVVNAYRDIWSKAEPLGRLTGVYGEDIYNFTLRHSLLGLAAGLRGVARRVAGAPQARALSDGIAYVRSEKPALCVSLMPFVNDTLAAVCAGAGVPLALVMTDLMDVAPFIWYTPKAVRSAVWVAAPCPEAAEQARGAGAGRVIESGLLLHPKYLDPGLRRLDRREARRRLGLDPELPTVLVSMGGFAGASVGSLVEGLDRVARGLQVVVACGRNAGLLGALKARPTRGNRVVPLGFTGDLHLYLRAADVMVGKPGPASVFEAAVAGTPMVLDAAAAMPQESPNAAWAGSRGWARVVTRRRDLPTQVAELLADRAALKSLERAVDAYAPSDASAVLARAVSEAARRVAPVEASSRFARVP